MMIGALALGRAPGQAAPVSVYLHSAVPLTEPLCVGDIAHIRGDASLAGDLAGIEIEASLLADGYIDRGELQRLIAARAGISVIIFGSAVRIETSNIPSSRAASGIARGQAVTVLVKKKGITLKLRGTAQAAGMAGDTIPVKTGRNTVLQVRVVNNTMVEKTL
jgi:hypothetical protein